MVNINDEQLSHVFMALADETRREMVRQLANGSLPVKALSNPNNISKSAVTKHLKILERAGLLTRQVVGREHICSLNPSPLAEVNEWLAFNQTFWEDKFDALEFYLDKQLTDSE
ncbi:winged helix-turn-helix transcriptional regulator [Vibrio sp. S9_S30]|uniref:ArsR/SmtB family transcription factor n=1 Tax=Vibrio sp. S9_S30 TaxID=2720226 RepID=UPI0016801C68|nr:metalloregulator ArsR/SmtB family transcription factor [Vibrio sp. S9_S30]MBD1557710.1 winged helix-turn-helix transcriptional regulator [Vibrio sp. S9_S30]